ncbi:uncharacterized protein BDW47DRAFT_134397 [Aspergillus candidus]|uniref:Protein kinase domain-containing protein n=1 Tax=Aspergillus candidus TaxID=41067 RepID=A0A2I2F0X5_ASPCN|nr:hypothetical protein BDW47DRAFT_134397 [Aspergillus candidus]PLB34275.1 hypothetical protein BDW47DRAFT_134397 [Aspergillus candidus]
MASFGRRPNRSKPPVPYVPDWRFQVKSHIAPAPTPAEFNDCFLKESDWQERQLLSPVMQCVKLPPAPGRDGDDSVSLQIMDLLDAGDKHEAQVFTVRLLETTSQSLPPKGTKLVAKLYDPLYYDDEAGALDPFVCLDWDYTHEVKAYAILRYLQGHRIPRYHGSYSLTLPVDGGHTRTVRMILIEHIPGLIMEDANPEYFDQSLRQDLMRSIVDLESELHEKNVSIMGIEPRKITLTSPTSDQPRVMFVDLAATFFGQSRVPPAASEMNSTVGGYISPLLRWKEANDRPGLFADWIDWEWDSWIDAEYAHTDAEITKEMRELYSDD